MAVSALTEELAFFKENRTEFLKHSAGKFALIKGRELISMFDTEENAYKEGVRILGSVPFLIQQILPEDPIADAPAYFLGVMHAGI